MEPYFSQLQSLATKLNIPLLDAFARAKVPTSTYYRSANGTTEMRYDTACRIYKAIYEEHSTVSKL
jgi:predicted transcriptional regulator